MTDWNSIGIDTIVALSHHISKMTPIIQKKNFFLLFCIENVKCEFRIAVKKN